MAKAACVAAFVFSSGCALHGVPAGDRETVIRQGAANGFRAHVIVTKAGQLFALLRQTPGAKRLTVFIESDGAPWFNPRWPPADPTPERSIPLALAFKQEGGVAYLARPCQFAQPDASCAMRWWTTHRFSTEAVGTLSKAIDELKRNAEATELILVGYSGGGVLATLLAQRRDDVAFLVTLAAPLALAEWTRRLDLSPLPTALDPWAGPPLRMPARHFAGGRDDIVPPALVERFARERGGRFILKENFDHACCWDQLSSEELLGDGS